MPYRGNGAALTDLMNGTLDFMFAGPAEVAEPVQAGRLRAIATSGAQRAASSPQLPTVGEAGVSGFEISVWHVLSARASTPASIVARLRTETAAVLASDAIRETLQILGLEPAAWMRRQPTPLSRPRSRSGAAWCRKPASKLTDAQGFRASRDAAAGLEVVARRMRRLPRGPTASRFPSNTWRGASHLGSSSGQGCGPRRSARTKLWRGLAGREQRGDGVHAGQVPRVPRRRVRKVPRV